MEHASARQRFLILLPIPLIVSVAFVFSTAAYWLGDAPGYLIGFGFYWLWCLSAPLFLWGRRGLHYVLAAEDPLFRRKNWLLITLLSLTIAGAVWMYFIPGLALVSFGVLLFSPIAIINGTAEEILWRGVYVKAFGHNVVLGCVYPAIGFALFHLAPTLVFPAEGETFPFIMSTFALGLVYGWVAYRTKTARWTAITHSLAGLLAFGEPISTSMAWLIHR
ncbi:MAG: CPBP family intramembrane glutamic endopeptidase [Roseiflexaceae bacterium]|nr:CPBP family intramembrane metalloprotease [Roseiflexus sp.]MDW8214901.1 CPBP family intramembrane glutamic endopeptidase [Roseiflexaceae bacterium]